MPRGVVRIEHDHEKELDPYARIRKMPEIRNVEPSEAASRVESPLVLDFSSFGASSADVQKTYATMHEWLGMPFIEDTFTNHLERRVWRKRLAPVELDLIKRNKFRNNLAGVVTALFQYLPQDMGVKNPSLQKRMEAYLNRDPSLNFFISKLPKTEGVEERKYLMKQLEEKVIGALRFVAHEAVSAPPASRSRPRVKGSVSRKAA